MLEASGTSIALFVYKPASYRGEGLIVSLHGQGRNASGYRDYTRKLAERFNALLVVPHFDQDRFPGWRYQRAGIVRRDSETRQLEVRAREQWTGEIVRAIVAAIREQEGAPDMPYVLMGHSAGGQFLTRMTAFAALPAARVIIANPSAWVAASLSDAFPHGFGGLPAELGNEQALERYLAQPITVLLGTADTEAAGLSQSAGSKRQGAHRYARGLNVFRSAAAVARERGWAFGWRLVEVPGVGHSARAMYEHPAAERAFCPQGPEEGPDTAMRASAWPCARTR